MTFKLEIYTTEWVDVSDYVINSLSVPFIKRNKDYTISAEGFFLYLSQNIDSDIVDNSSEVKFYIDGSVKFYGVIKGKYFNRTSYRHELTIFDQIIKLQDYDVEYDTLHSLFVNNRSGDDYAIRASADENLNSINTYWYSIPFILETMFTKVGLTIDTSELLSSTRNLVVNKTVSYDLEQITASFKTKDFFINEYMLYCINQSYATNPTGIDNNSKDNYNYEDNKISFFDFVSFISSICGLYFSYSDGYVLHKWDVHEYYNGIEDNYLLDKSERVDEALSTDYKLTMSFAGLDKYYTSDNDAIYPTYKKNDEGDNISWYNNLLIAFYKSNNEIYDYTSYLDPTDLSMFFKGDALTKKGAFTEIEADIKTDIKNIVENMIVLTASSRISKIIQGSYNEMGLLP